MTDFETHPIGTAKRIATLEAATLGVTEDQYSRNVQFHKYHAMQGLLMLIANDSDSPYAKAAADILAGRAASAPETQDDAQG